MRGSFGNDAIHHSPIATHMLIGQGTMKYGRREYILFTEAARERID